MKTDTEEVFDPPCVTSVGSRCTENYTAKCCTLNTPQGVARLNLIGGTVAKINETKRTITSKRAKCQGSLNNEGLRRAARVTNLMVYLVGIGRL